jgi:hypothetical protein
MYVLDFLVPLLLAVLVVQTGLSVMKLDAILKALTDRKN